MGGRRYSVVPSRSVRPLQEGTRSSAVLRAGERLLGPSFLFDLVAYWDLQCDHRTVDELRERAQWELSRGEYSLIVIPPQPIEAGSESVVDLRELIEPELPPLQPSPVPSEPALTFVSVQLVDDDDNQPLRGTLIATAGSRTQTEPARHTVHLADLLPDEQGHAEFSGLVLAPRGVDIPTEDPIAPSVDPSVDPGTDAPVAPLRPPSPVPMPPGPGPTPPEPLADDVLEVVFVYDDGSPVVGWTAQVEGEAHPSPEHGGPLRVEGLRGKDVTVNVQLPEP